MATSNTAIALPERQMYSIPEVMHVLNVSRQKIYDLISEGKLRRIKIGGSTRFRVSEVEAYIESISS